MNSLNFILLLVCFTPVSLQNGAEITNLQGDLLNLLEIKEKPSVARSRSQVPKYVMDLYKEQAHTTGFTKFGKSAPGKTIRTFFRDTSVSEDKSRLYFNLSSLKPNEQIEKAELRLFKRRSKLKNTHGHFKVTVYRLNRRPVEGNTSWKKKLTTVATKHVKCRRVGGWVVLNVTSAVSFWSSWPSRNFGLWISVKGIGIPTSDFFIATGGRKEPILVIYGDDKDKKQDKSLGPFSEIPNETRHNGEDKHNKGKGKNKQDTSGIMNRRRRSVGDVSCARHKLFVKFRDLNWDKWIIAPRGFSAYYCMGTCPEVIDKYYDPSNHAIIQNLLHHRLNKNIPAACCVPTSLNSMSLMYFELDGSIVLKEYPGMVASTCGCR